MGRRKSNIHNIPRVHRQGGEVPADKLAETWKRKRPERIDQTPPYSLPNVDVHGLIFAVLAVVFVVYPLAQYFLGL